MTEPHMTGTVERRAPVVTELWERCRHRYSDERMILRYCGGPDVWMHVCLGCGVPVILHPASRERALSAKSAAIRGARNGAKARREVAA